MTAMKRIFALVLTLTLLLSLAVVLPAAAEQKKPVTLETWIVQTDWSDAWDNLMKPRFEEQYPWITLEAVGLGGSNVDYIRTRIPSGSVPDVWQVDNDPTYYNAVDEGLLVDLNTLEVSKAIPQAYRDAFTYKDKLFGLTQGAAFSVLYLNMKILEDAGWTQAPANWEEFIRCCDDIKTKTGVAPLTLAGDKTTTCWMLFELIAANVAGDTLGLGVFETQFLDGTLDFTAYPQISERLAQVAPYMLTGTASMTEDDVTAAMTDGTAAMAIAGNWTANNICSGIETASGDPKYVKAVLAPFNDEGKGVWISVSPETAFGLSNAPADPEVLEARELFFNWVFQPENFAIIQNARGTVPVLETMTAEQIKLPAAISEIVPAMNAASFVKMGFNLWTNEFRDAATTALKDVYGGNREAADAVKGMTELLKTSNRANIK
ncbi:MAG: extracellular solute-binding protein [Clostridiales bacterium]|nr:extracellular solute-binding protein [Clostridiales bacterium]